MQGMGNEYSNSESEIEAAIAAFFDPEISDLNPYSDFQKDAWLSSMREKVGLVGSRSRSGRVIQSAVSIALPGDMGDIRSPIRSTIAETLTPGGGGGGRRGGLPNRIGGSRDLYRCPAGFENGGKFTNRLMNTCGLRIFDTPDAVDSAEAATGSAASIVQADDPKKGKLIRGGGAGQGIDIQRAPNIARVSKPNKNQVDAGIANSIAPMASSDKVRLIRRDGTILDSVTSKNNLLKLRGNDDILNGAFVVSVNDFNKIGYDDVDLLRTGVASVVIAMPDGISSIRIDRKRGVKDEGIRKMSLRWNKLRDDKEALWTGALEQLASEASDSITIQHSFPNIKGDAAELIQVQREDGSTRTVRRWIFEMFMAQEAPARPKNFKPWSFVEQVNGQVKPVAQ
jgi:hypothetical protein